jgi:hypothetical protein
MRVAPIRRRPRHVLFVQAADAATYPPIIHAANLMAEAGWLVCVLSAPIVGTGLEFPRHPGIDLRLTRARPSHVVTRAAYAGYTAAAARLALRQLPDVVYASDPLGAGPGLLAARLTGGVSSITSMTARIRGHCIPSWRACAARRRAEP